MDAMEFTTLFVCGNHENFDMLYKYPTELWNGGLVRKITPNILHLTRGQVFEINGNSFFTFGGGMSIDKLWRQEGRSWWPQEIPTHAEIETGLSNLERVGNKVDYVLTHTCPSELVPRLNFEKMDDPVCKMLDEFQELLTYKLWYFGHMHVDRRIGKFRAIYNQIHKLGV